MQKILAWLNPRNDEVGLSGEKFHSLVTFPVVLILILAAAALIFVIGFRAGQRLTPQDYASRYEAPLRVPTVTRTVSAPRAVTVPPTGSISFNRWNTRINDQGSLGSCQAWSFAKQLSYAFNVQTKHYRFYSPRYAYDSVSNGQDQGSYLEQYPPVATTRGLPTFDEMPYGTESSTVGLPPYALEYPIPQKFHKAATDGMFHIAEKQLWGFTDGAGFGGVALMKEQIAAHRAVNIDFPVYASYDDANATGATVNLPPAGENSRGGHANVAVKYDDNHANGDGSFGAFLASNQWSAQAGVGKDGTRHTGAKNGYVWISYAFTAKFVYDAAVLTVAAPFPTVSSTVPPIPGAAKGAPISADGKNDKLFAAPSAPAAPPTGQQSWYVQHVVLTTGQDVSGLLNAWGDKYHVWPIGLAATLGVESSLDPNVERWGPGLDQSCGLAQQILVNVTYYTGIQGQRAACDWEKAPANSIYLESRLYASFIAYLSGCVNFAPLYSAYNGGPGLGCAFLANPYGEVGAHYQVFLGWWNYSLAHWQYVGPPAFKRDAWHAFRKRHRLPLIWARVNGKLTYAARSWQSHGPDAAGAVVSASQRFNLHGKFPYVTERFEKQRLYFWVGHPSWTKWQDVKKIT